jgi:RHS repeat-associated protein
MDFKLRVRCMCVVVAAAWLVGSTSQLKAQGYLASVGVVAFSSRLPVENGWADMSNGLLHLEIPLGTFPQRGGHAGNVVLLYDSNIWMGVLSPSSSWQPTNISTTNGGNSWGGWRLATSGDSGHVSYTTGYTSWCSADGTWRYGHYHNWIYTAPDGTTHAFPIETTQFLTSSCFHVGSPTPNGASFASDASGYYMAVTSYTYATVYAPDGTIVYNNLDGNRVPKDSNGNYYSYSAGQLNDTLNRAVVKTSTNGNVITYQLPSPQGGTSTYTVTLESISVHTAFNSPGFTEYSNSITVVQSIQLPNGSSYSFGYDGGTTAGHYGLLTSMTLPTGSTVNYNYALFGDAQSQNYEWLHQRITPDGTWTFAQSLISTCGSGVVNCQQKNTVTKPNGDTIAYTFTLNGGAWQNQAQYYTGSSSLLSTVTQCWNFVTITNGTCQYSTTSGTGAINVEKLAASTTTPIPNGSVTETSEYSYDGYGNTTKIQEWNYYTGSLPQNPDRTTTVVYQQATNYVNKLILNRPASVTVTNSGGTTIAQTLYSYDGGSLTSVTGMPEHDDTNYSTSNTTRGNVTLVQSLVGGSTYVNSSATYDTTGQPLTSTDPKGNVTTFNYSACCYNSYPTTITGATNVLNQATNLGYDFNTGLLSSITDPNNQATSFLYDSMSRPTRITYPDGGQTNYNYPNPNQIEVQKKIDSRSTDSWTQFDGLGRLSRQATANDESSPYDQVDTCYDVDGRVKFQSYAYQNTGFNAPAVCSGAGDTFTYDGLSRVIHVTHSDGMAATTAYTGRVTCVSDEGNGTRGVERCSQTDAFGRITSVCEITGTSLLGTAGTPGPCNQDSGGTGFLTTYGYDLMNNLTSVSQGGYLNRTFTYDSLSRLLCASNPEMQTVSCPTPDNGSYTAGTTRYSYDNNGNIVQRIRPAPNQTNAAVTVTTTYAYDALDRLKNRTYSDGVTPGAHFVYDSSSQLGVPLTNPIGRLSEAYTDANNGVVYGYDAMGRVKVNNQAPPTVWGSTTFAENYNYDFVGDVTSSLNGEDVTPFTLNYSYNRVGLLTGITSSLSDSNHPGTLLSGAHYNALGSPSSATLNGGIVSESRSYDARLRLSGITNSALSTTFYSLSVPTNGYAPNSNMLSFNDTITDSGQSWSFQTTWTYGYDDFNRVSAANESDTQGGQAAYSYGYDRFGNRWQQNGPASMMLTFSGNNNRIDAANGVSYDAPGNVIGYHPPAGDTFSYAYDAENRLTSVTDQTTANKTCYTYDANGRRVERTYNCGTINAYGRDFLYDLDGHQVSQVEGSNVWDHGDVYAGGRLLATYVWDGTIFFNHPDQLGSARVRTDITGQIHEFCSNLPFGELTCSGDDPSPMHFTGQEHDFESGLDNFKARYYDSPFGRFMSTDPTGIFLGNLNDPQQLNLYSYVRNSPVNFLDPNGLDCEVEGAPATLSSICGQGPQGSSSVLVMTRFCFNDQGSGLGGGDSVCVQIPVPQPVQPLPDPSHVKPFKGQPQKVCSNLSLKWHSIEWTVKVGAEFEFGPADIGASLFKNTTTGETGGALTLNLSDVAGVSVAQVNPAGVPLNSDAGQHQYNVQGFGLNHNFSDKTNQTNFGSKSIGGLRAGLMAGIGVEASLNGDTYNRLAAGCSVIR